jgi:hypothetical protein
LLAAHIDWRKFGLRKEMAFVDFNPLDNRPNYQHNHMLDRIRAFREYYEH